MVDLFTLKLMLSFIVGAGYVIFASVIADKMGHKLGGLISGLPSTVLFGLLFIAWTQTPQAAVEATTLLPATIGIACYFLIVYIYFVRYSIWTALALAYLLWGLLAFVLIATHITNFLLCILIFCVSFVIAYMYIFKISKLESVKAREVRYTVQLLLLRGILSGSVVAFSVLVAKIGGPIIGGIFTTFPAIITSVLLINYFSHGPAFTTGIAKNTLFGWISSVLFVIMMRYTLLQLGIIGGTFVSLLVTYLSAYLLLVFVLPKHS